MPTTYEIHISVHLATGSDEVRWLRFCAEKRYHVIRVLNHAGEHNVQNMISLWHAAKQQEDVVAVARQIGADMRAAGFQVVREKVEAMIDEVENETELDGSDPSQYWECHMKIRNASTLAEWKALASRVREMPHVGVSQSVYSRRKNQTILTIRVPKGTKFDAAKVFQQITSDIANMGYQFDTQVQRELSVFDTNPQLDKGWIWYAPKSRL